MRRGSNTEDLKDELERVKGIVETSRIEVERFIRRRPIESAGIFLIAGLLLGAVIGVVTSRED